MNNPIRMESLTDSGHPGLYFFLFKKTICSLYINWHGEKNLEGNDYHDSSIHLNYSGNMWFDGFVHIDDPKCLETL
jgi:hypothetical protein